MTYQHNEAFCLMFYACPCGHRERMWNSRDGVTPFGGITCPSCGSGFENPGGGLQHINFAADLCVPDHKLRPGQRFWRDGTTEEAVAIMERRFAIWAEKGHVVPDEVKAALLNDARTGAEHGDFRKGWPYLDQAPIR